MIKKGKRNLLAVTILRLGGPYFIDPHFQAMGDGLSDSSRLGPPGDDVIDRGPVKRGPKSFSDGRAGDPGLNETNFEPGNVVNFLIHD